MAYETRTVIRPVRLEDLEVLVDLARQTGPGLTSLPADKGLLRERVENSLTSFAKTITHPNAEDYLFVLEDTATHTIVGCSAIIAAIGYDQPFYSFHVSTLMQMCESLDVTRQHQVLHLVNDYTGDTEIGSLFLLPAYRAHGNGLLLSRCRFFYMANEPQRFAETVVAEMRGVLDEQGYSAFWQGLGKHFFAIDFTEADYLTDYIVSDFTHEFLLFNNDY